MRLHVNIGVIVSPPPPRIPPRVQTECRGIYIQVRFFGCACYSGLVAGSVGYHTVVAVKFDLCRPNARTTPEGQKGPPGPPGHQIMSGGPLREIVPSADEGERRQTESLPTCTEPAFAAGTFAPGVSGPWAFLIFSPAHGPQAGTCSPCTVYEKGEQPQKNDSAPPERGFRSRKRALRVGMPPVFGAGLARQLR
jgi:hypothetical protein